MTLLSPSKFSHVNDTIQLIDKESYGLALSQKSSELFFFLKDNESILSVPLDDQERCFKLVYSEKIPTDNQSISEIIKLSDAREELYLMDFENNLSLKGIDINNYSIKWQIQSGFVNPDDFRMEYSSNFLFIIDDDSKFVYKIDLSMQKIIVKKEMINTDNSEIIYNKDKDVLYLGEWNSRECSGNYFAKYILYEMDGKTLDILRNISVPGPTWDMVVSKDGTKLYCAFPFESFLHSSVYVFDTESFEIIDKIDVPLGTRAIVLDDERQLLFAGSAATNLIDIIDLKTKKTIKTYKAGDYSIREMILDKKRRNFYVSTQHFGVFKGNY